MLKKSILITSVFTVVLAGIHAFIIQSGNTEAPHWEYMWTYPLLLVLTLGVYLFVNYVRSVDRHKAGMTYLVASTIKMFACLGFLIPNIMGRGEDGRSFVINFIIPYFLLLGFELFWTVRIIRQK